MGCDVHIQMEIKVGGKWLHYSAPRLDRNYKLFSKMAGVRGDETPIAEPRGLPHDCTETTRLVSDYDQGHTHSWLSSDEIAQLCEWYEKECKRMGSFCSLEFDGLGYLFGNGWNFKKYPRGDGTYEGVPPYLEDVRMCFWFDS